jgi:TetR/AcrR family transcriptional repressor of nem operon
VARLREFDEDQALDAAMHLFWKRGYQAASLSDLLVATDLSKSSFYEAFGSKRDLLLRALRRYAESAMSEVLEPLSHRGAGRAEIEEVFARMKVHTLSREGTKGCLINNCITEVAPHEPDVLAVVQGARRQLEGALLRAVQTGQDEGTITRQESASAVARFLLHQFSGMSLAAKVRPGREYFTDVVRLALKALNGPDVDEKAA